MYDLNDEMDRCRGPSLHLYYRRFEGRRAILHDMFVKDPITIPFMFMDREDCGSVAQKLAARSSITELEYITAYIVLLHDEEVYDTRESRDMFHHLRSMAEDSLNTPWYGALYGPYDKLPFSPWFHVSLLMTREKADPTKRRVIVNMSYPAEKSINAFILKSTALGDTRQHCLPTVDKFAKELHETWEGAYIFHISRAYIKMSVPAHLTGPSSVLNGLGNIT